MERQTSHAVYHVKLQPDIKPENMIIWGLPLVFCLHLLDEIFLNGGFVFGVQRHIWPAYDGLKFGLVNAAFFLLISFSSCLYSIRPDKWIILPCFGFGSELGMVSGTSFGRSSGRNTHQGWQQALSLN